MFPNYDTCDTSVLKINGDVICRISHPDKSFRQSVIESAMDRQAPCSVEDIPRKFWSYIASTYNNGRHIDAIKLVRIIDSDLGLGEAKAATEFIATVEISL
jgi:hypothetical protein